VTGQRLNDETDAEFIERYERAFGTPFRTGETEKIRRLRLAFFRSAARTIREAHPDGIGPIRSLEGPLSKESL